MRLLFWKLFHRLTLALHETFRQSDKSYAYAGTTRANGNEHTVVYQLQAGRLGLTTEIFVQGVLKDPRNVPEPEWTWKVDCEAISERRTVMNRAGGTNQSSLTQATFRIRKGKQVMEICDIVFFEFPALRPLLDELGCIRKDLDS